MFYIVETEEHLELLTKKVKTECFIEIIMYNDHIHPILNRVSAVYVKPLFGEKGFIMPVDHVDGINISLDRVQEVLDIIPTLYTVDKKKFLYFFKHKNVNDIALLYSMVTYGNFQYPTLPSTVEWYYFKFPRLKDINCICSLPLLYQYCEELYEKSLKVYGQCKEFLEDPSWKFYNNTYIRTFLLLEHSGLKIKKKQLIEKYKVNTPHLNIEEDRIYTQYNLYNRTSRPTNSFNNINFAAIPKSEEYRSLYLPQSGEFVEIDFDGYHIRLLGELVDYRFSQESIHEQLGRLYFKKDELSPKEYKESKQKTFHILYGGVPEEYKHIEFFKRVANLTDKWWEEYQEHGVVRDPISKKPFTKNLKDMDSKPKLMNYLIQSLETSRNVTVLKKVLLYLMDKKSFVSLYTYDALLIDLDPQEEHILEEIPKLLDNDKFPVKINRSKTLFFE